jgi:hypothetical protein
VPFWLLKILADTGQKDASGFHFSEIIGFFAPSREIKVPDLRKQLGVYNE